MKIQGLYHEDLENISWRFKYLILVLAVGYVCLLFLASNMSNCKGWLLVNFHYMSTVIGKIPMLLKFWLAVDLLDLFLHYNNLIILSCTELLLLDLNCCSMSCLVSSECVVNSLLVLSFVFVILWQLSGQLSQGFRSQEDSVLNVTYASPDSSDGT